MINYGISAEDRGSKQSLLMGEGWTGNGRGQRGGGVGGNDVCGKKRRRR